MKRLLIIMGTLSLSLFVRAEEPQAQGSNKREAIIQKRMENQQRRIQEGSASGRLNEQEKARLEKRQDHVEKMNERAMQDGQVSKKEFHRIERAQNHNSRAIHRKKDR